MFTDEEFTAVMNEYGDTVLKICYVRLKNMHDAQDAFQDVFLELYRTKNKPESSYLKPWLIRVACNKCVSVLRIKKPEELSGLEACEDTERDDTVTNAVLSLNRRQRTAIYMFYYENMKTKEIAECMNISEGNVRTLLHRGRENLKKILGNDALENGGTL